MAKLKPAASVPASAPAAAGTSEATTQDTTQAGAEPTGNAATEGETGTTGDAAATVIGAGSDVAGSNAGATDPTVIASVIAPTVDGPQADAETPLFPRVIRVMNNGPIALAEPVSGVYVGPGGSHETTLHDEDHAHRVLENFRALLEANFLQPEVLRIDGLPE